MKYYLILMTAIALLGSSYSAMSASPEERLCQKVQQCFEASLDESDMTASMRSMIEPMTAQMCDGIKQGYEAMRTTGLESSYHACLNSLANQACEAFGNDETPECQAFERQARKKYGG